MSEEELREIDVRIASYGCPLMARAEEIRSKVANVSENWLDRFKLAFPDAWRKLAESDRGTVLYDARVVLWAVWHDACKRKYNYSDESKEVAI